MSLSDKNMTNNKEKEVFSGITENILIEELNTDQDDMDCADKTAGNLVKETEKIEIIVKCIKLIFEVFHTIKNKQHKFNKLVKRISSLLINHLIAKKEEEY